MINIPVPRLATQLISLVFLCYVARLALAAPFLLSGCAKLLDFVGAVDEVAALGLKPAGPIAVAIIVTQLGGSLIFLTTRHCWLGAGILASFTALATVLAHPFWAFEGTDRVRQSATFIEHVAIIGGLAVAALLVNRRLVP